MSCMLSRCPAFEPVPDTSRLPDGSARFRSGSLVSRPRGHHLCGSFGLFLAAVPTQGDHAGHAGQKSWRFRRCPAWKKYDFSVKIPNVRIIIWMLLHDSIGFLAKVTVRFSRKNYGFDRSKKKQCPACPARVLHGRQPNSILGWQEMSGMKSLKPVHRSRYPVFFVGDQ